MLRSAVRRAGATLVLALAVVLPLQAEGVTYPDSAPGRHARAFFEAFAKGESSMRAFWAAHGSRQALTQRPIEARLAVYAQMRGEFRSLDPLRVAASGADFVEVVARTAEGSAVAIRFLCDAGDGLGLAALRVEDAGASEPAERDGPAAAPTPAASGPPPSESEVVAALRREVDSLGAAGSFSGAMLLDKSGSTLFARARGWATLEPKVPNLLETGFNLGSLNKVFTHVAILQLERAGKLRLDDTLDRYLTDYRPADAKRITLRMLLEHRAGVPDFFRSEALRKDPEAVRSLADWYGIVRDMPLDFAPGTRQSYSNGGFVLLGAVIAEASGEGYDDYIEQHIYDPAGMVRSGNFTSAEATAGFAAPLVASLADSAGPRGARVALPATQRVGRGSPAGGGYSTVADLVRFANALRGGVLLDSVRRDALIGSRPAFAIAGGSPGVNALLLLEGPYTLAVLANIDPPAAERFATTAGAMLARLAAADAAPR